MLNALANHGYIPRSGRDVSSRELVGALVSVGGLTPAVAALFAHPLFLEYHAPAPAPAAPRSWWRTLVAFPVALLRRFGLRRRGQVDGAGRSAINLDRLALPGRLEHDVSLTRRDRCEAEGCVAPQPDLVRALLAAASADVDDGGEGARALSVADLAGVRRRRIEERKGQEGVTYGWMQHGFACAEIALLLGVLGEGRGDKKRARVEYARAFFEDERLPVEEGWRTRRWGRRLGLLELGWLTVKVRNLVGLEA